MMLSPLRPVRQGLRQQQQQQQQQQPLIDDDSDVPTGRRKRVKRSSSQSNSSCHESSSPPSSTPTSAVPAAVVTASRNTTPVHPVVSSFSFGGTRHLFPRSRAASSSSVRRYSASNPTGSGPPVTRRHSAAPERQDPASSAPSREAATDAKAALVAADSLPSPLSDNHQVGSSRNADSPDQPDSSSDLSSPPTDMGLSDGGYRDDGDDDYDDETGRDDGGPPEEEDDDAVHVEDEEKPFVKKEYVSRQSSPAPASKFTAALAVPAFKFAAASAPAVPASKFTAAPAPAAPASKFAAAPAAPAASDESALLAASGVHASLSRFVLCPQSISVSWSMRDLAAFLDASDGVLYPKQPQKPHMFAWEYLFSHLGATPPHVADADVNEVSLSISGQVFCNLVNLYSHNPKSLHFWAGTTKAGSCDTALGEFGWAVDTNGKLHVTYYPAAYAFSPGPVAPLRGVPLAPGRKRLDVYWDALSSGISDDTFGWPDLGSRPYVWFEMLRRNLQGLKARRPRDGALVVTPTWLQTAKYARRIMMFGCHNGNAKTRFYNDILTTLHRIDESHARLTGVPVAQLPTRNYGIVGTFLMKLFSDMENNDCQYTLVPRPDLPAGHPASTSQPSSVSRSLSAPRPPSNSPPRAATPAPAASAAFQPSDAAGHGPKLLAGARKVLASVLEGYQNEMLGTWLRTLYNHRDDVCRLMLDGFLVPVDSRAVVSLPFDTDSELWTTHDIPLHTSIKTAPLSLDFLINNTNKK